MASAARLRLCRKKRALTVEYALRNVATPIGVSEFVTRLAHRLETELNAEAAGGHAKQRAATQGRPYRYV